MRRLLAAAALTGLTLLAATACSTEPEPEGSAPIVAAPPAADGGPSAPAGGASAGAEGAEGAEGGDAALSGNTAAICNQAQKTGSDFAKTFAENLKLQIDAASSEDPAAKRNVTEKAARDVQSYSYALDDLSKLADDAGVKKALGDLSKEVAALKTDVGKVDEKAIAGMREGLDKACGQL